MFTFGFYTAERLIYLTFDLFYGLDIKNFGLARLIFFRSFQICHSALEQLPACLCIYLCIEVQQCPLLAIFENERQTKDDIYAHNVTIFQDYFRHFVLLISLYLS